MEHYLKILPVYYEAVKKQQKLFEVRRNDRPFAIGDVLILEEFTPYGGYSGAYIKAEITYILNDLQFCKQGYVILGIRVISNEKIMPRAMVQRQNTKLLDL